MYGIDIDDNTLKCTSKEAFKYRVKLAIQEHAFNVLKQECHSQSKTQNIVYNTSKLSKQAYLSSLYPSQAKVVLKCRSRCLKIKQHRPYLFSNNICRWCNMEEETLEHIFNCGQEEVADFIDLDSIDCVDARLEAELISLATRVNQFLDLVDY